MGKIKKILETLNEQKTVFNVGIKTDLDEALEIIEEFDLGFDCLKSNYYNELTENLTNFLESLLDDSVNENFVSDAFESMFEGSGLVKPLPYHNMFSKSMGNRYSPIMQGRMKGGNNDVSVLQLGDKKFYEVPMKHYFDLHKQAMGMAKPRQAYNQIMRALINLYVNFSKKKPALSNKAKSIANTLKNLAKPDKFIKSKELKKNREKK